jgi:hypothetical protein
MKVYAIAAAGLLIAGCSVTPEVNYHLWNEAARDDSWIPYQLTDTTLVIGVAGSSASLDTNGNSTSTSPANPSAPPGAAAAPASDDSAAPPAKKGKKGKKGGTKTAKAGGKKTPSQQDQASLLEPVYRYQLYPITLNESALDCYAKGCNGASVEAAAVPIPYEGATLGIEAASHWMVYTRMAPSYYPNSLRLQTLELSVDDKRQEALQTFGALAVGVAKTSSGAGFAGAGAREQAAPKKLTLPIILDLADAKATITKDAPLPRNEAEGWTYHIRFMDDPEKEGFPRFDDRQNVHRAILTSLCRPVQITLTNGNVQVVLGVTVADPDYLLPIPLPPSGTVTFGTLCGANMQMNQAVTTATNQLVNSFFADVQSLRTIGHHKAASSATSATSATTTTTTTTSN